MKSFFQKLQFHISLNQQRWRVLVWHKARVAAGQSGQVRQKHLPVQRQMKQVLALSRATAEMQTFPHHLYQWLPPQQQGSEPWHTGAELSLQSLAPGLLSGDPARQVLLWTPQKRALWQCSMLFIRDSTSVITEEQSLLRMFYRFTFLSSSYHQFAVKTFANETLGRAKLLFCKVCLAEPCSALDLCSFSKNVVDLSFEFLGNSAIAFLV